jgi:hypothetical protein
MDTGAVSLISSKHYIIICEAGQLYPKPHYPRVPESKMTGEYVRHHAIRSLRHLWLFALRVSHLLFLAASHGLN